MPALKQRPVLGATMICRLSHSLFKMARRRYGGLAAARTKEAVAAAIERRLGKGKDLPSDAREIITETVCIKQILTVVLFVFACGLASNSLAEVREMPDVELSLDQLKNGLKTRFDKIENLTMVCTATEVIVDGDPPKNLPKITSTRELPKIDVTSILGDSVLGFPWFIAEHRLHKNMRYSKAIHPSVGLFSGAPAVPKPDIPWERSSKTTSIRHAIDAWDGKVWTALEQNGEGQISEDFSQKVLHNVLFKYLDYPVNEFSLRDKDNLYLPNSIEMSKARVLLDYEEMLGHKCHVIEVQGLDRLWVDAVCGYALVERVTQFSQNGALRRVLVAHNWQEVNKGVWLPSRVDIEFYCSPSKHRNREGKVSSRIQINTKFSSTPLGPEKFRIEFPKGVDVWDHRTGEKYVVGGGRSTWDEALNVATNNYKERISARRFWWKIACLVVFFVVCVCLIFWRLVRWLRSVKSE